MFLAKKIIASLLQPLPLSLIVALLGLYLLWLGRHQKLGKFCIGLALIMVFGFSTPFASNHLIRSLEQQYPSILDAKAYHSVKYIVVLGGGHAVNEATPISSHLSSSTLKRLVEGLRLQRALAGPGQLQDTKVILSGGAVFDQHHEADTMASIAIALGFPSHQIIIEKRARDTSSQAVEIAKLLGEQRFFLVTSAAHMPRSMLLIQNQGLKPIAAPTDFHAGEAQWKDPTSFLPNSRHLKKSERAIHEYLGQWWAQLAL